MGSNLSAAALARGEELAVLDNLVRLGSRDNLKWLRAQGDFIHYENDIRDAKLVESVIRDYSPDIVFHFAGQVAMTTSIEDPRLDFEVNTLGTLNVLESLRRHSPEAALFYSSTNKVYGDLEWVRYNETSTRYVTPDYPNGFDEATPLDFRSPYGCSKGSADSYIQDYSRIYGLRTCVFRHSSMYGGRQYATFDQGWVGWFCSKAVETAEGRAREPFTIAGSGKQVRDLLHARDMVALYFHAVEKLETATGHVFNIGGGYDNSLSLLELFTELEGLLGIEMSYIKKPARVSDQKVFIANITKAKEMLDWEPEVNKRHGLNEMLKWSKSLATS